jgi:NAD(P)-dependent dehydrogenase (short-subunit alcohol dehydrogenase family)
LKKKQIQKHILITGGTGYLGPKIIESLLECGYKITSLSRQPFNHLISGNNSNFKHILLDIESREVLIQTIKNVTQERGNLNGVIVMANKASRKINFSERETDFVENLSIGPLTTYITLSSVLEFLHDNASLVVFGSLWGSQVPEKSIYPDLELVPSLSLPASKAALIQLTKYFAAELAQLNIRVNLLTPGWFPKPGPIERPEYIHEIKKRTPLGRLGKPEDLIGAIKFLLDDSSSFMTGHNLIIDGGFSLY